PLQVFESPCGEAILRVEHEGLFYERSRGLWSLLQQDTIAEHGGISRVVWMRLSKAMQEFARNGKILLLDQIECVPLHELQIRRAKHRQLLKGDSQIMGSAIPKIEMGAAGENIAVVRKAVAKTRIDAAQVGLTLINFVDLSKEQQQLAVV